MENRNYTVEPWRASKTALVNPYAVIELTISQTARDKQVVLRLRRLPEKLHFNQDGIKRGRVAQVGEFFRREDVNVLAPGCKFCPVQLGRDHPWRNTAVDLGLQLDLAPAIKYSNFIPVANATRFRVARIYFQKVGLLQGLHARNVAEGRIHEVVGLAGEKLKREDFCFGAMA